MLKISNLTKQFNENNIIGPFDFELNQNNYVSIIGSSGSGKTTLIKMIIDSKFKDQGEVISSSNSIGYISQKDMFFKHLTILGNLKLTCSNLEGYQNIFKTLSLSEDILKKFPYQLSGGEKQRLNIARTILNKNEVLILDEAFSALDTQIKDEIYFLLSSLKVSENLLIISVTHDLHEAFSLSDQIIYIHEGKICFNDTPKKLIDSSLLLKNNFISKERLNLLKGVIHE